METHAARDRTPPSPPPQGPSLSPRLPAVVGPVPLRVKLGIRGEGNDELLGWAFWGGGWGGGVGGWQ